MKKTVVFFILLLVPATVSHALRCGSGLVQVGDVKVQVLEACGDPILVEFIGTTSTRIDIESGSQSVRVIVENWHYDVGGGVIHVLTFAGSKLIGIDWYRK